MKKLSLVLSFFFLLVFSSMFYSCEPIEVDNTYEYNLNVLWENKIFESDDVNYYFLDFCIENDNIAMIYNTSNNYDKKLAVFKTNAGEIHPSWVNPIDIEGTKNPVSVLIGGENNDIVIVTLTSGIKAYSLDNQTLLWEKNWRTSLSREQCCFGDKYYIGYDSTTSIHCNDSSSIYVIDVHTGVIKDVIDRGNKGAFNPIVGLDNAGDTILYYQEHETSIAYNLTTDNIKWTWYTGGWLSSGHYSTYLNNNLFCSQVDEYVYAYNIETGDCKININTGPCDYGTCLLADNYLFSYMCNDYLKAYDITGSNIWTKSFPKIGTGNITDEMTYYNGMLYYISLELFNGNYQYNLRCANAATSQVLWTSTDNNHLYSPHVDNNTGILYAMDSDGLIAYDLKNSPVITINE